MPKDIRLISTHYFIIKIPNKRELQEFYLLIHYILSLNTSWSLRNHTTKSYLFLVIDDTPASDNTLHFRKNLLERTQTLIITIDDKIRDEKQQYDINREGAKISALSSRKIDKYEYLRSEEIVPFNQIQIIEHAKFAYPSLGKAFEKETERQVDAIKSLDPSNKLKQMKGIFPQNLMNDLIRP